MAGENVVSIVVRAADDTAAGFDASKASAEGAAGSARVYADAVDDAAKAEQEFRAAQAEQAEAQGRLDELEQGGTASADELAAALDKVTAASLRSMDAQLRLGEADLKVSGASKLQGDAAEDAGVKSDVSGGLFAGAGSKMKMAALGVAVGMGLAVKSAMDFQQESVKWVTSAGESASQLGMLQQGVLALSAQTATSSGQLASGLYMISSAGITGAGGLSVLKAAAEGAKSEGADLSEVTSALTSGINAYGMKTKTSAEATVSATSMMNQMLATVSAGKMTFQELASSLSSVLPVAAANKISYAQVGGALATMTSMGISARQGTQDLAATISHLANPTSVATNEMAEFGISSTDVAGHLGQQGLTGTVQMLSDAIIRKMGASGLVLVNSMNQSKAAAADANTMLDRLPASIQGIAKAYLGGSASYSTWYAATKTLPLQAREMATQFATVAGKAHGFNQLLSSGAPAAQTYAAAMAKMLGGATGLNVGLMLTGTHAATFDANVKSIAAHADGASGQVSGFSDVTKETSFQLSKAADSIKAAGTELGMALLPAVNAILKPLASMLGFIAGNKAASIAFAVVVGGVLAGALGGKLASAFKDVKSGVKGFADGIGWLLGKLGLTTAATEAQTAATGAQTAATEAQTAATEAGAAAQEEADAAMSVSPVMLVVAAIALLAIGIYELVKHWKAVEDAFKTAFKAVRDAVMDAVGFIRSHWELLLAILTGPIGLAVLFIKDNWKHITDAFSDVIDWIKTHWQLILAILTGPIGLAVLFIKDHWHQIIGFFEEVFDRVTGDVRNWGADVIRFIKQAFDRVTGDLHNWESDILHWFGQLPGKIINALSNLGSMLFTAGKNAIKRLLDGAKSMIGEVGHVIGGIASKVAGFFGLSPAREGELSGSGAPEIRGAHFAAAFASGMLGGNAAVRSAAARLASSAGAGTAAGSGLAGSGGTGAPMVLQIQLGSGGSGLDQVFWTWFKNGIRAQGGDPRLVNKKVQFV